MFVIDANMRRRRLNPLRLLDEVLTAKGQMLVRGTSETGVLAPGSNDAVLTLDSGQAAGVKWATPAAIISDHGGLGGLGDNDHPQYLLVTDFAGTFSTAFSAALLSLLSANGDMLIRNGAGAVVRLPKGTDGQVLKMVAGVPAWADLI